MATEHPQWHSPTVLSVLLQPAPTQGIILGKPWSPPFWCTPAHNPTAPPYSDLDRGAITPSAGTTALIPAQHLLFKENQCQLLYQHQNDPTADTNPKACHTGFSPSSQVPCGMKNSLLKPGWSPVTEQPHKGQTHSNSREVECPEL